MRSVSQENDGVPRVRVCTAPGSCEGGGGDRHPGPANPRLAACLIKLWAEAQPTLARAASPTWVELQLESVLLRVQDASLLTSHFSLESLNLET